LLVVVLRSFRLGLLLFCRCRGSMLLCLWYVVVFMVLKFCSSVVFCVIVMLRVVWFTLCVVFVMLSVMFMLNGVVLRLLVSFSVMLKVGVVVSIPIVTNSSVSAVTVKLFSAISCVLFGMVQLSGRLIVAFMLLAVDMKEFSVAFMVRFACLVLFVGVMCV